MARKSKEYIREKLAREVAILGMPCRTAGSKLDKLIILNLIQRTGDNICHRCNEKILSVDELSIDHKESWRTSGNPNLYWDIDNIAFSHFKCNSRAGGIASTATMANPWSIAERNQMYREGFSWCNKCQSKKPLDEFGTNNSAFNGKRNACKACGNQRARKKKHERRKSNRTTEG